MNRKYRIPPLPDHAAYRRKLPAWAKLEQAAIVEGHLTGMYHATLMHARNRSYRFTEYERGVRDSHRMTYRRIAENSPWLRPLIADAIRSSLRDERRRQTAAHATPSPTPHAPHEHHSKQT